ncbi:uncharacterized protein BO96DRAFT_433484 [Aspergillus niger CBS 101883]|uniref:uncharacterized protein n=1 Tax=Aspergillus lacticoffeatus (strain CBS 101883) TaxID=1450533 RepID=UPI000D7F8D39|nr:uncharacterized protein BO96DRAFT_433484 [Aspergillus niger CBS 101883]PYH57311.1 hypothetical protein BO96DRAFT_433484 [Aspergillus niger CBS 101883]
MARQPCFWVNPSLKTMMVTAQLQRDSIPVFQNTNHTNLDDESSRFTDLVIDRVRCLDWIEGFSLNTTCSSKSLGTTRWLHYAARGALQGGMTCGCTIFPNELKRSRDTWIVLLVTERANRPLTKMVSLWCRLHPSLLALVFPRLARSCRVHDAAKAADVDGQESWAGWAIWKHRLAASADWLICGGKEGVPGEWERLEPSMCPRYTFGQLEFNIPDKDPWNPTVIPASLASWSHPIQRQVAAGEGVNPLVLVWLIIPAPAQVHTIRPSTDAHASSRIVLRFFHLLYPVSLIATMWTAYT